MPRPALSRVGRAGASPSRPNQPNATITAASATVKISSASPIAVQGPEKSKHHRAAQSAHADGGRDPGKPRRSTVNRQQTAGESGDHAVRRGIVGAEEQDAGNGIPRPRQEAAERHAVRRQQRSVPADEDRSPPDPVGEVSDRDRQDQKRHRRAGVEQRDPEGVGLRALDEEEVEERVADGDEAEREREDDDPAKRRLRRRPEGLPSTADPPIVAALGSARALLHQQHQGRDAQHRHHERREEDHVVAARHLPEHEPRGERSDGGAGRVERAVHAERRRQLLAPCAQRDHGVARGRADRLADRDRRRSGSKTRPRSGPASPTSQDGTPPKPHSRRRPSASIGGTDRPPRRRST